MSKPHVTTGRFAPPEPAERTTVTSFDGTVLNVELHGPKDAPAVVLVHGWACSIAYWAAQVRDLAKDHRVIVYDLRGHGRSTWIPGTNTGEHLSQDLEAVMRATLAPGQRAVVGGHSMGAMTVMASASKDFLREHAAAVLMCNTGPVLLPQNSTVTRLLPKGRLRTLVISLIMTSSLPLGPVSPVGRFSVKWATMGPRADRDAVDACTHILHANPRKVRSAWGAFLRDLDVEEKLTRLDVPVELVLGGSDRLTPPGAHAALMERLLPQHLGTTIVPGVGHMGPPEAADTVIARLRALTAAHLTGAAEEGSADEPARKAAHG